MALLQKIQDDVKAAQKAGDHARLGVLRFVLAQIHNREIEKRSAARPPTSQAQASGGQGGEGSLTDAELIGVLQKEVKKRKEAIDLFRKGNRGDLVQKEERELQHILLYIPPEISREEVEKVVDEIIAAGTRDFNAVMKESMQRLKGKADGKAVSEIVRQKAG